MTKTRPSILLWLVALFATACGLTYAPEPTPTPTLSPTRISPAPTPTQEVGYFEPYYIGDGEGGFLYDPYLTCDPPRVRTLHWTREDVRHQDEPCGFDGWLRFPGDSQLVAPFVFHKNVPIEGRVERVYQAEYFGVDAEWGLVRRNVLLRANQCYLFKLESLNDVRPMPGQNYNASDIAVVFYFVSGPHDELMIDPVNTLQQIGTRHDFPFISAYAEVIQPYLSRVDHVVDIAFGIDVIHPKYDATFAVNAFGMMIAPEGFCN